MPSSIPDDGPPIWCWINRSGGCGPLENRNPFIWLGSPGSGGAVASSAGGGGGCAGGGCGSAPALSSANPVRYWNGAVVLSFADIVTPYNRLTHTRSYNNRTATDYDGPNGWNWFIAQMAYVVADGSSIAVAFDPNFPIWFDFDGNTGSYVQRDGSINLTLVHDATNKTFPFVRTTGSGGATVTTVFNDFTTQNRPGQFVSQTDTAGVDTTIASLSGAEIAELQTVMTVAGTVYYGSLVYAYYASGANAGKLASVTYRRKTGSGGSWVNVKQFTYTYHDGNDSNGNLNDLKTATEQQYDSGTSSWQDVAVSYYRYYVDTAGGTGFVHGLKLQIGPEGYRRAFNDSVNFDTASDATLKDYADHYFEYDPSTRMVTKEVAAVCVSCPGGGTTADTFAYSSSGFADGVNNWKYKTVQTLPNGATLTVYSNFRGAPILHVYTDSSGTDEWYKFWRYNGDGQVVIEAESSAITVNEITSIGTSTDGMPVWATPAYDAAGNMTAFVKPSDVISNLTAIYDAWNRLVAVKDGASFVAAYVYDGLKRRVAKKSYTAGVLSETRDFYFGDQWQALSEAVGGTVDKTYAWGLRYVNELLWRNDSTHGRLYAMQDASFNCTAICDTSGSVVERYQFDPYGARVVLNPSWTPIASSAYAWTVAHQGLMLETDVGLYNSRNRVYSPLLGVWMTRIGGSGDAPCYSPCGCVIVPDGPCEPGGEPGQFDKCLAESSKAACMKCCVDTSKTRNCWEACRQKWPWDQSVCKREDDDEECETECDRERREDPTPPYGFSRCKDGKRSLCCICTTTIRRHPSRGICTELITQCILEHEEEHHLRQGCDWKSECSECCAYKKSLACIEALQKIFPPGGLCAADFRAEKRRIEKNLEEECKACPDHGLLCGEHKGPGLDPSIPGGPGGGQF